MSNPDPIPIDPDLDRGLAWLARVLAPRLFVPIPPKPLLSFVRFNTESDPMSLVLKPELPPEGVTRKLHYTLPDGTTPDPVDVTDTATIDAPEEGFLDAHYEDFSPDGISSTIRGASPVAHIDLAKKAPPPVPGAPDLTTVGVLSE